MEKKRGRIVAIVITLAVVALCTSLWVNEGPLWRLVSLRKIWIPATTGFDTDILPIRFGFDTPADAYIVRQEQFDIPVTGWYMVRRWSDSSISVGKAQLFYESGVLAAAYEHKNGFLQKRTYWNPDGALRFQGRPAPGRYALLPGAIGFMAQEEERHFPPWWWGVTDQPGPEKSDGR